jgi:hypothetical protein
MQTTRTKRLVLVMTVVALALPAFGQSASGTLNATLINKSAIGILFNTDPSGVTLGGAGTAAATLNFGAVSMYMTTPPAGVTLARTSNNFTISSIFDAYVFVGGVVSASYLLQANLAVAPGALTYKVDAVTLSTVNSTIVAADPNYDKNAPHTLFLTIPNTVPAGPINNTVNFTVTAN